MTFSERLSQAMKEAGHTQGSLSKAVGMAQSSIWKLVNNAAGSRKSVELAQALGVNAEWLATGTGPMKVSSSPVQISDAPKADPNYYRVDVLDVQASAGNGYLVSTDFIETIRAIEYTPEQARSLFGNRPSDAIKVITVRGDSMEGTIEPGDQIFVDSAIKHFDGDGVYVFVFGKTMHVKRLQMQKDKLLVISDNKVYHPWYIEEEDQDQFHIMAKVLLRQSIDYKRFS